MILQALETCKNKQISEPEPYVYKLIQGFDLKNDVNGLQKDKTTGNPFADALLKEEGGY